MQKSHSTYTIQELPVDRLERDPEHPRRLSEAPNELYPLLASIRALGQMEAIAVCPTEGGRYMIVDGNRRFRCAQQLHFTTVFCKVYPALSRGEVHTLRFRLQTLHKPWTIKEKQQVETRIKMQTEQTVYDNEEALIAALYQFQETAARLMQRLADQLKAPLDQFATDPLAGRAYPQTGDLDAEWQYAFHGLECRFTNRQSKQIVEAQLGFSEGVGVFSPYFFALFLQSTPGFEHLAETFINGFPNIKQALNVLEKKGSIYNIQDELYNRGSWLISRISALS